MTGVDRSAGTIQVEGLRELRRTLKAAGDDLSDLKDANQAAATIAAQGATHHVPTRTGALAATIRATGTKTAGVLRAGKKTVPYALAVHWGRRYWPRKGHRRAVASPMEAQPFLSQGAQATEPKWVAEYNARLEKIISTVEGK